MKAIGSFLLRGLAYLPRLVPRAWRRRLLDSWLASVFRKAFIFMVGESTTVVTLGPPLEGYQMRVNLQMQKAYIYGTFEEALVRFILDTVQDGWNVFDVGANIGYVALLIASRTPAGRVYAFEPLPSNFACLQENADRNKMPNLHCELRALGETTKQMTFHYRAEALTAGGSIVNSVPYGVDKAIMTTEVAVIPGDEYMREHAVQRLDLVKIDVEGAEGLVLRGMLQTLRTYRPLVVVELHSFEGSTAPDVPAFLSDLGYNCHMLDGSHLLAVPG